GLVNMHNANYEAAVKDFAKILDATNRDPVRGFDFSKDWVVINKLGEVYYQLALQSDGAEREDYLKKAVKQFETTLSAGMDPENIVAHEFLHKSFKLLGGDADSSAAVPPTAEGAAEKRLAQLGAAAASTKSLSASRVQAAEHLLKELPTATVKCRPAFLA